MSKKYRVKSNLKHDGIDYVRGNRVDLSTLDDETIDGLLRDNIISDRKRKESDEGEREMVQPNTKKVSREGDDVEGKQKIEEGKKEQKQPGDGQDNVDSNEGDDKDTKGDNGEGEGDNL